MLTFSHGQKGDVPAQRELKVPHRLFGIAADEEAQELFITAQWPAAVFVYRKGAEGREAPLRILEGPKTQLAATQGIVLDTENQAFYVANWGYRSEILEGKAYSDIPVTGRGIYRTWPMPDKWYAFWRNHRYVPGSGKMDPPSIAVFPLKASGNTPPLRMIQGSNTQLDWPAHISLDVEHQELFVSNTMENSVLVFRATDSGNAAPIRVLKGPKTEIDRPLGMYYDPKHQEIVVSNWGNQRAVVFPRTAQGDSAPVRRIRSAP